MKRIKYNRRFVTAGMRAADMLALRALRPCLRLPGGSPSGGAMHSAHAGTLRQAAELTAAGRICGTRFPGVASQVSVRQRPHAAGVLAQWSALARRRAPTPTRRKPGAVRPPAGARYDLLPLDAVHEKRSGRLSFAHILPGLAWLLKTPAVCGLPSPSNSDGCPRKRRQALLRARQGHRFARGAWDPGHVTGRGRAAFVEL